MKLGFFIQPVHPPSRPYADVLREDREAVVVAARLGYREGVNGAHLVGAAATLTPRRAGKGSPSVPACCRLPTTTRRWPRRRLRWSTTW
jgi:hypothetical protein